MSKNTSGNFERGQTPMPKTTAAVKPAETKGQTPIPKVKPKK